MTQPEYLADDLNDEPVSPERQKKIEEIIKEPLWSQLTQSTLPSKSNLHWQEIILPPEFSKAFAGLMSGWKEEETDDPT
jgi:hypothetical protein